MEMIRNAFRVVKHWPILTHFNRYRLRKIYQAKPSVINLELGTKCNAKCRMCPHPELEFDKKIMSAAALDIVLDGLEGAVPDGSILYPVGLGEPLLIPNLHEMNRRISERFPEARIHFNTNGILLGHARSRAFLDYSHRIVISLNSPDKETYATLMRVDKFDDVVKGAKDFLARRKIHPRFQKEGFPHVEFQMMGLDAYSGSFEKFKAEWLPLLDPKDEVYFNPMDNWGGKIPDKNLYSRKPAKRYPCGSIWRMVSVDVEGDVFPCCVPFGTRTGESIKLGNVLQHSLRSILANGKLDRIKQLHLEGKDQSLEACRGCDVYRVDPNIRFKNPFTGKWV